MGIKMKIQSWWNGMTFTEKVNTILRGVATTGAIGGAVVCVHEVRKSRDILNFAVGRIGENVDVQVSDDLINVAVERAANRQIQKAVNDVVRDSKEQIALQTKEAVEERVIETRKQINDNVSDRIAEECRKIHEQDLLKEIRDQASEKLANKLDCKLDSITDEYTRNLSNMGKIYSSLADKLQSKA